MIWCRPPPRWDAYEGGFSYGNPLLFLCVKTEKEEIADG